MNKPSIDEVLAPKPELRPRIYAYAIADAAHAGLLKVGQTTRDVRQRVAEQLKTAAIQNFTIELDENAFFTVTQSKSEITIVAPQSLLDDILSHFDEEPKAVYRDQVGITVRFSKEYLPVPNVLYTLQAALAVHKINFTEVISTYTEFSFIIDKENLEIATRALQKFLR